MRNWAQRYPVNIIAWSGLLEPQFMVLWNGVAVNVKKELEKYEPFWLLRSLPKAVQRGNASYS